jgi:hypothetical protein
MHLGKRIDGSIVQLARKKWVSYVSRSMHVLVHTYVVADK